MPTVQEILTTVNTTYRNTYTNAQKVEWMDTVQRQIYQKVPKEAPPYVFTTIADNAFYALPDDCDRFGIKEITIERKAGAEKYETLPFLSVETNQQVSETAHFYTVLQNNMFLNPMPTDTDEGKKLYIVYNHRPAELSSGALSETPELEEDFHELLVLGVLERIARARGEIDDKNNFASDYNVLLRQYENQYKLRQPEYYSTRDMMPRQRRGHWVGSRRYGDRVSDLIPPGLL